MQNVYKQIADNLIAWYPEHARDLPWRKDKEPYHVWLSEIMLQQTRVEAVKEYYRTFLQELPTIEALAEVDDDRLMKLWEGLGYYNRARNLKKAAGEVVIECQNTMRSGACRESENIRREQSARSALICQLLRWTEMFSGYIPE